MVLFTLAVFPASTPRLSELAADFSTILGLGVSFSGGALPEGPGKAGLADTSPCPLLPEGCGSCFFVPAKGFQKVFHLLGDAGAELDDCTKSSAA